MNRDTSLKHESSHIIDVFLRNVASTGLVLLIMLAGFLPATVSAQGYPGHWQGKWIWDHSEPLSYHYFLMARRTFEIGSSPASAELKITADDRYILYVNGEYLGRGPARSDPRWKSFDSYNITERLRSGSNTIAVLGYHYGSPSNYNRDARSGLFVQVDGTGLNGEVLTVATDSSWRVHRARGWNDQVGTYRHSTGMTEVYDANVDPVDWMSPTFDDSSWDYAFVIPQRQTPWSYLESRQTPMMRELEIFAERLVGVGELRDPPPNITFADTEVPERLYASPHFPLQFSEVSNAGAVLKADGRVASLRSSPYQSGDTAEKGGRSPYVIVDFGQPVFGFPRVRMDGPEGAIIEITYGPELVDGRVPPFYQGLRQGDRYVLREGDQVWQTFEYKQFRYIQLVASNATQPVSIDSISVNAYQYPAERLGSFACSDPVLTKLWEAGVNTTYLHMEDALICDAARERRVWTGDGAHGLYGIYAAYGDIAITDWFFRLIPRGQLPDGMLRMFYPGTDLGAVGLPRAKGPGAFDNPWNIPQFALFYALFTGEHYQYFGKRELMQELYPALVRLAGWCDMQSDETGLLYNLPNWNFVDWVENDMRGANLETNALYYKMLRDLEHMAADLGKSDEMMRWQSQADRVLNSIRRLHWDPDRGLYANSYFEGKRSETITELSNGMVLLFDIAISEQVPAIVHNLLQPKPDLVQASPLYYYYAVEGLIRAGASSGALEQMATRYNKMMTTDDFPTVWEIWPEKIGEPGIGQISSKVHSGGVGPTWTLSKHVLGVKPLGPGFSRCRIEPQTGDLEWARGVFPSVRGDIAVSWKRDSKRFVLDVHLPDGMETDVVLPREVKRNAELIYNDKSTSIPAGAKSMTGFQLADASVVVSVRGGSHRFEIIAK